MTDLIKNSDGLYKVPAFVDTHIHGAFGVDTCDFSVDGIVTLAKRLPEFGVAAFCPTTMTIGEDVIYKSFDAVSKATEILESTSEPYAKILGVHLEGPFLSPERAGVQDQSAIVYPKDGYRIIENLKSNFPGLLKIIDIAPELDGAMEFIKEYSKDYVLSLAHTDCDYDTACKAFECGAGSVTHLLNAMNPCSKRNPGVLGAAFDNKDVFCEIICDGIHIDKTILRMLFTLLDEDRIIIVSDSMRGAGMPDGIYKLASADVEVSNGRTYYGTSRGLAGSVTNLSEEVKRLKSFGIDMTKIIKASSVNPLKRLGLSETTSGLFNYLDDEFNLNSSCLTK